MSFSRSINTRAATHSILFFAQANRKCFQTITDITSQISPSLTSKSSNKTGLTEHIMKKFGLPSGYYEDHAYEKLEGPRNRSKISSLFHREPPVFNKETWCRNCAYWISPNPAPAVHSKYWKTDLVVAGDCPICEEQLKLGILLIHPWIRDFEKVKGIKSAELINAERATLAYWNDRSVRRMAKLEKHVKSLERHQKVLEMNEDEFVAQCLTVEHRWNKLEQDRRAVNYGRQLFNKTWCRNCSYWVAPTYDAFSMNPRYKIWETRLIDSRDCPVCWVKIGVRGLQAT